MVPAGNKAKRLSSVNHTTKTIHHHHLLNRSHKTHCTLSLSVSTSMRDVGIQNLLKDQDRVLWKNNYSF